MLVLTRKIGERICIGEDVVVTVIYVDNNRVRLGIEAPRSVPIWRSELVEEEQQKEVPWLVNTPDSSSAPDWNTIPAMFPRHQAPAP